MIDFHGGPRASLLTWLSGAPSASATTIAGRGWMYTRRVARPRGAAAAALGRESVGPARAARRRAAGSVGVPGGDAGRRRASRRRSPIAWRAPASPPAIGSIVMHVSAGNPFRRWPAAHFVELVAGARRRRSGAPRRRHVGAVGTRRGRPRDRRARGAARRRAPARCCRAASSRSPSCARCSIARRSTSAATAARCTSRRPPACRSSGCTGRRCRCGRRRGAPPSWITESVDAGELPCRPCDQRVCEPGDFRCLTSITPAQVLEAAERALMRAERPLQAEVKMNA